jgi:hypothetical protein
LKEEKVWGIRSSLQLDPLYHLDGKCSNYFEGHHTLKEKVWGTGSSLHLDGAAVDW